MKLTSALFDTAKIKEAYTAVKGIFASDKSLNDDLAGIVGNQFVTLSTNKVDGYNSHYCIYRGIDLLAESVAQLPLQIYRGDTLMPVDFRLNEGFNLNTPHPQLSLNELLYKCCVYFWYRGEFMLYIDMNNPFSIEPVNPNLMARQKNGSWKWNNSMIIPEEQLVYVSLFNPDGDRGLSPIDVVKAELVNDTKAGEYNTKFFENFAQIGGTLTDPKGMATADQMKSAVKQFNQKHASSSSAYKTAGLTGGITFNETAQTMREMEFLESRREVRDKILAVLGIHKALFGVTESVDRAVSLEATRQLWLQVIKPKAIRIQQKMNQQLFNRYFPGYRCQFNFSSVDALKQGVDVKLKQVEVYRALGYTMNELNEKFELEMETITDPVGDLRLVPTSLIPVDDYYDSNSIGRATSNPTKQIDKAIDLILENDKPEVSVDRKVVRKLSGYFSKQLGKVLKIVHTNKDPLPEIKTLLEKQISDNSISSIINKSNGVNTITYRLICEQVDDSSTTDELIKRIQSVYKYQSSNSKMIVKEEINNGTRN